MKKGEHYLCSCCGADLVVLTPCTCQQKQDLTCTCGAKMEVSTPVPSQ